MAQVQVKIGRLEEIIYHNEDNGYVVAMASSEIDDGDGEDLEIFTVVGYFGFTGEGRNYRMTGTWKNHHKYGAQFVVSEFSEIMPETEDDIEEFLASGAIKGIGPKTAWQIVNKFGKDTFRIIEEEPMKLTSISGIGQKKAALISEDYKEKRALNEVGIFLQKFGIPASYAPRLYRQYGGSSIAVISENPYQIVGKVAGIGFRKADDMAEKLGLSRESENRIKSGIKYILSYYVTEGNTYLPKQLLCERAAELLGLSSESIEGNLINMAFDGEIQIEKLEDREIVFLMSYYMAEQNVCKKLLMVNGGKVKQIHSDIDSLIMKTEAETGISLSENQKYAVKSSLENGVSVITGGPGTGKTTIINAIMKILVNGGLKTAIAAPTGRAAKRITETSGYEASTLHRLLEYYYSESDDSMKFGRNAENVLEYDVIIVDEASMIDIILMNGLMAAVEPSTRLIFVGDVDQLPPVGAGNVLRDMIESEIIYSVRLTEIFRQAKESLIVVNAHRINKGEDPYYNEKEKDFFFIQKISEDEILETIKELCQTRLPAYLKKMGVSGEIQVLTPQRKGVLGSINLNVQLQEILNPAAIDKPEHRYGERIFRLGDKVMQIKNNYQLEWRKETDFSVGQGVFNGEVGIIRSIDREYGILTVLFDDNKFVEYEFAQLDELELAYAVTVHKSQGSEFSVVVMPMWKVAPMLATRNLLYTGVTRGRNAVVMVGLINRMSAMIENDRVSERYSGLKARLIEKSKEREW